MNFRTQLSSQQMLACACGRALGMNASCSGPRSRPPSPLSNTQSRDPFPPISASRQVWVFPEWQEILADSLPQQIPATTSNCFCYFGPRALSSRCQHRGGFVEPGPWPHASWMCSARTWLRAGKLLRGTKALWGLPKLPLLLTGTWLSSHQP